MGKVSATELGIYYVVDPTHVSLPIPAPLAFVAGFRNTEMGIARCVNAI